MSQSDRIMQAKCRLLITKPWYGHIAMSMVWISSDMPWMEERQKTMGVRIASNGQVECLYYPPFVASLSINELYAVIQHEIEHIVRLHCVRVYDRDRHTWNIAADMAVNGLKSNPRIGYEDKINNKLVIPHKDDLVWIPINWHNDGTTEEYYDKLMSEQKHKTCHNCGKKSKKSQSTCPKCGSGQFDIEDYGNLLDSHDVWDRSEVSQDEARQIVKDLVDQANEKHRGSSPGHLQRAIDNLSKPIVNWREMLRYYLGYHLGNQRYTYSRRSRRRDMFGIPGISHHAASDLNIIIDTSGSISQYELRQFFSEIEMISSKSKAMVLQWDSAYQGYEYYRRGDWKKIQIKGGGGTDMAAPLQWLISNKLVKDVQIMLTDGYCNYMENIKFPMITVLTDPNGQIPNYGHVVRMPINSK